jgi:hypothetical protein
VTFVVLHLHQGLVNILNVAKGGFAVCNAELSDSLLVRSALTVGTLKAQERAGSLRVAESNLTQTALNNQLSVLWSGLGSLNGTLNLLLHSLHVVVTTTSMPATCSVAATSLEKVCLSKLVQGLARVLSRGTTDLSVDLVVKVLGELSIRRLLVDATSSSQELLQLNASDEILVLRGHEAVILGQQENLVVALSALGLFCEEVCTLFVRQLHHLVGLSNRRTRVRVMLGMA